MSSHCLPWIVHLRFETQRRAKPIQFHERLSSQWRKLEKTESKPWAPRRQPWQTHREVPLAFKKTLWLRKLSRGSRGPTCLSCYHLIPRPVLAFLCHGTEGWTSTEPVIETRKPLGKSHFLRCRQSEVEHGFPSLTRANGGSSLW